MDSFLHRRWHPRTDIRDAMSLHIHAQVLADRIHGPTQLMSRIFHRKTLLEQIEILLRLPFAGSLRRLT